MKKSNIILISLLVALYIIPAIVWGFNRVGAAGNYYTGFGDGFRTVQIENRDLKKEDIIINPERASAFPNKNLNRAGQKPYLYYKGNKRYLPVVSVDDDELLVGKAVNAPEGANLKLHIRINDIRAIMLNGETIFSK